MTIDLSLPQTVLVISVHFPTRVLFVGTGVDPIATESYVTRTFSIDMTGCQTAADCAAAITAQTEGAVEGFVVDGAVGWRVSPAKSES